MASDFTVPAGMKTVNAISLASYLPSIPTFVTQHPTAMASPGALMMPQQALTTPHHANIIQHQAMVSPHQGNMTLNTLTPSIATAARCSLATTVRAPGANISQPLINFALNSGGLVQYPQIVAAQQSNIATSLPGTPTIASVTSLAGTTSTTDRTDVGGKTNSKHDLLIADHSKDLKNTLSSFHTNRYLHDAFITVCGQRVVSAHRVVLAAFSPVFHNMFDMGPEVKHVLLPEWTYEDLKVVIDAMYTGVLELNRGNVDAVMAAIKKLKVTSMVATCERFLAQMKGEQAKNSAENPEIIKDENTSEVQPIEIAPRVEGESSGNEQNSVRIKTEPQDGTENSGRAPENLTSEVDTDQGNITGNPDLSTAAPYLKLENQISPNPELTNQNSDANNLEPMETDKSREIVGELITVKQEPQFSCRCRVCGKDFPFYSNLRLHQLKHGQPRSSGRKENMPILLKQSKNLKGYKCGLCQKIFKQRFAAVKHIGKVHYKKAQCKKCHRQFLSYRQLQIHKYSRHKAKTRIAMNCTCLQCGRVFRHQKNADKHTPCRMNLDRCSTTKTFQTVCTYCNQKFRHPRLFQRHKNLCLLRDLMMRHESDTYPESTDLQEEQTPKDPIHNLPVSRPEVESRTWQDDSPVTPKPKPMINPQKPACEDFLFQTNILGDSTPDQLLLTMMYMVFIYFSNYGCAKDIYRDQLQIHVDEHGRYIQFYEGNKVKGYQLALKPTFKRLYENKASPKTCFVQLVSNYLSKCPKTHDYLSPFFLVAKKEATPCYWYNQRAMGQTSIDKIQKRLSSLVQRESRRFCIGASPEENNSEQRDSFATQRYREIAPALAVSTAPAQTALQQSSCIKTEQSGNSQTCTYTVDVVPEVTAASAMSETVQIESRDVANAVQTLNSPKTCVSRFQNWLSSNSHPHLLRSLMIDSGSRIEDLKPWQLYFLLKFLVAAGKMLDIFSKSSPCLNSSLLKIARHYIQNRRSKTYLFEEANIQSILRSKAANWRPNDCVPSLEDLVSKNVLGDKDPHMLLRSVVFLMAVTFQLTSNELLQMSRSMVILDTDARGRYLCLCRCENKGFLHAQVHSCDNGVPESVNVLGNSWFANTPLKVYEKPETPQSCLVNLMSLYLSKSPTVHLNLFLQPISSRKFKLQNVWWYRQQAAGRMLMGVLLNDPLKALDHQKDSLLDVTHGQAFKYQEYQLEECEKCAVYSQDQKK